MDEFTDAELHAYLDETLVASRAALLETHLRQSPELRQRFAALLEVIDQGGFTIGEVWRRGRIGCFTRQQLGAYCLGTLSRPLREQIDFHVQVVGCRFCAANLDDLKQSPTAPAAEVEQRRRRFYESSVPGQRPAPRDSEPPEGPAGPR